MAVSQVHEILIAKNDHHLLSADADVYALAYKDTLAAFEEYLTVPDRAVFLQHLEEGNTDWFTGSFIIEPKRHYFLRFLPRLHADENIRLILSPVDKVIDSYQDMVFTMSSQRAMLGLFEDLFFEYRSETDTIIFYNTDHSHFDPGEHSFTEFVGGLQGIVTKENVLPLEMLIRHIKEKTASFAITLSQNIFNEDPAITDTMFRGAVAHHEGFGESVIGLIHPLRQRGSGGEGKITYDALTGLINKADITQISIDRINNRCIANTSIAIVDIDYFKHVNDSHGHQFGDLVLRQVAAIMKNEIGEHGLCGRIGGDEFFVIFNSSVTDEGRRAHLCNIKSLVKATFPDKGPQGEKPITLSIGSATYPSDATNYNDLFMVADYCLYLAKEKGRNRYIMYTRDRHPSLEQIRNRKTEGDNLVNGRDDLPLGDVLVQMQFMIRYGKQPALTSLLSEFSDRFNIPLVMLALEDPQMPLIITGKQEGESAPLLRELDLLLHPAFRSSHLFKQEMVICNNIIHLPAELRPLVSERLEKADIHSFVVCPFTDTKSRKAALIFISLHYNQVWNEQHYMYYRLFVDSLKLYDLKPYCV